MTYDPNNPGGFGQSGGSTGHGDSTPQGDYGLQGGIGQPGGYGQQGAYGAAGASGDYSGSGYGTYSGKPELTIGGALSFAWEAFTRNVGGWLLLALINLASSTFGNLPNIQASFSTDDGSTAAYWQAGANLGLQSLTWAVTILVGLFASAWAVQAALRIVDGETLPIAEFFKFRNFGNFAAIYFLCILGVFVGSIVIIIGWIALIVAAVLFYFVYYAVIDGAPPVKEPFVRSYHIVKDNLGLCLGLGAAFIGLTLAAVLTCGLGFFVVIPMYYLASAYVYRHLSGGAAGASAGTMPEPQYPQQY